MAKVLITGGAGFIGANLTRRLLAEGHAVTVLDDFSTGRRGNVAGLGAEVVEGDVRAPLPGAYDWVFSLACPASPPHYQADPLRTLATSVDGMRGVLGLARRCGARVVHASTSEVYGDPLAHPQAETYWGHVNPLGPRACYDEGKRVAETFALEHRRAYGTDVRLVRIFNTYGPFMAPDDGRVVSAFILQALRGEPLTLFGDGSQTRSFQYVDDLVEAMIRTMQTGDDFTGPVNLGNPTEFTILQLAEKIIELTGSHSKLRFMPLPGDDPRQRKPDISLAKRVLDWQPTVQLEEGLNKTIEYFKSLNL